MNESTNSKGNTLVRNLGAIFFLISLIVVGLAYGKVYKDYQTKIEDMDRDISSLKVRRDELRELDNNKAEIQEKKEKAEEDREKILKLYDGDISPEGQIMDVYNILIKEGIQVPSLTLGEIDEPYVFGELPSSNPQGTSAAIANDYYTESKSFSVTARGTYDQIKATLRDLIGVEGKRKSIDAISIGFDDAKQVLNLEVSVNEYAIAGEDRETMDVEIPDYEKARENIFYNSQDAISE